jgi:hypothetical protein
MKDALAERRGEEEGILRLPREEAAVVAHP